MKTSIHIDITQRSSQINHLMALMSNWEFELWPEIMQSAIRVFLSTIDADITERNPTNSVASIRIFNLRISEKKQCVGSKSNAWVENPKLELNKHRPRIPIHWHRFPWQFFLFKKFQMISEFLIGWPMRTSDQMKPN